MSINFHQLTQTVLTIPKLNRPARSCASLTAGPACLHLPAYADVQTIKNEYGVKMSIRANAGIRMKDENRSKAGRKRDRIGGKSEIRANAGIRVKDENRSKAERSGAGLGENRTQERMRYKGKGRKQE